MCSNMSEITVATFTDDVQPLGQIQVNGAILNVYRPDEIEERHYIKYFQARADLLDIVNRYSKVIENPDGSKQVVPSDNPGDVLRMEAEMFEPSVQTIEALCQLDRKLKMLPKTAAKVYNHVEGLLNSIKTVEAPDPLESITEENPSPRKNRSKNISENS